MDARRRRIGEVLVEEGLISGDQLAQLLALQSQTPQGQPRKRLGDLVIESGMATEREVAKALAEALALPLVDLGRTMVQPDAVKLLPRAVAERAGVLVVSSDRGGQRVTVATADPTNVVALDDVKLYTGASELSVLVAVDSQVRDHLARSGRCRRTPPTCRRCSRASTPARARSRRSRPRASRRRRSSGSSTSCSPTPCAPAPPTSTSSRSPTSCASATASTACCATS